MSHAPGRLEARVKGRVQGVGFRWFVLTRAGQLGVTGGVRNLSDGSVEVIAEGAPAALDLLREALAEGPSGAHVTGVEHALLPASGTFAGFEVWSSR